MPGKFTSFTITPQGELAYSNTGRLAPSSYTVRGNTVYGADNRKIGNVKKLENLKKAQRQKVEAASRNRQHRRAQQIKNGGQKPRQQKPRKPSKKATPPSGREERDPNVPVSEEYLEEYVNLIKQYAPYVYDQNSRMILLTCTTKEAQKLHELAYDVYEVYVWYGEKAERGDGYLPPQQRAYFERCARRLAGLLRSIR